jgi:cardiolipin synthase (CMP-forming)
MLTKRSLPNAFTILRLVLLPAMWVLALREMNVLLGWSIVFAWVTDALDGYFARRFDASTRLGSLLDSVADGLLAVSIAAWLVLLRPEFFREHAVLILIWLALGTASWLVGWIRFRRIADLHLYSAKTANFLGFFFAAYLLMAQRYPRPLFYLVIGVCILAALETLLALLTRNRVDERMTSIFQKVPRREPAGKPDG